MGVDIYSEDPIGDYSHIERLVAQTCRNNNEYGDETDVSTDTCDDNISCDYVVGTFNLECNDEYQIKRFVGIQ